MARPRAADAIAAPTRFDVATARLISDTWQILTDTADTYRYLPVGER